MKSRYVAITLWHKLHSFAGLACSGRDLHRHAMRLRRPSAKMHAAARLHFGADGKATHRNRRRWWFAHGSRRGSVRPTGFLKMWTRSKSHFSRLLCKMRLAFSNSLFCGGSRFFPERLINIWTMRMPEPIPLGLTLLDAIFLAIVSASLVNSPGGGNVETV